MRFRIAIVLTLLAALAVSAQQRKDNTVSTAIRIAKNVRISSFDPALPSLTLQSFVDYETDHAPIDWTARNCNKTSTQNENTICVQADSIVNDQITVFVTVSVSSTMSAAPGLVSVEVTERGLVHRIRLIELPAAIHGRKFRSPNVRDLPEVLSTVG